MTYAYLMLAIAAEVAGTTALKLTEGFTRPGPAVVVLVGYGTAFYFLSLVLRTMPVGVAYAIWAGLGIVLIALVGWVGFGQRLDLPAVVGMAFILVGLVIMNAFSRTLAY